MVGMPRKKKEEVGEPVKLHCHDCSKNIPWPAVTIPLKAIEESAHEKAKLMDQIRLLEKELGRLRPQPSAAAVELIGHDEKQQQPEGLDGQKASTLHVLPEIVDQGQGVEGQVPGGRPPPAQTRLGG